MLKCVRRVVAGTVLAVSSTVLADPVGVVVHADKPANRVDVRIYGQFLEHIFNSVHGGLWGDQILNGSLELRSPSGVWKYYEGGIFALSPTAPAVPAAPLWVGDAQWTNYEFTVQARKRNVMQGNAGGITVMVRGMDGRRFYGVTLGGLDNKGIEIRKMSQPNPFSPLPQPVEGSATIVNDQWYTLRVRCEGNRVQVFVDDKPALDYTDPTNAYTRGRVGIDARDAILEYRNLKVQGLDGSPLLNSPLPDSTFVTAPFGWEMSGGRITNEPGNAFNADMCMRIQHLEGEDSAMGPGIRQRNIALSQGEKYTLNLYLRGAGEPNCGAMVQLADEKGVIFSRTLSDLKSEWQKFDLEVVPGRSADGATLSITNPGTERGGGGAFFVDQVSLFSAAALANGGYRLDLYKAIADLKPATIRWPGGSFANNYIWQYGVGPREKRLPHPVEQWGDRDPNQFGTDEFMDFCQKVGAEPVLVLNTSRGLNDALHWLEYCLGDATTEYGKIRAANGHPAPYPLKTIEIDNEAWLLMREAKYLTVVQVFCPAIRQRYPKLQLSVCGSYAYDTGPGEGVPDNANWDDRLLEVQARNFDVISPHYYNGLLTEHPADYREDPRKYEVFLKGLGERIKKSDNPAIKIYVSEWNLTYGRWGNDWRVGLYAGGVLNAFERQGEMVTMSCPALFMRKIGVTNSWDNALINFDQKGWFPAANYVVMKLWRDNYAPTLLATEGPDHPLNFTATRSEDGNTVYLKVVNPDTAAAEAVFTFDGAFAPRAATMELIAPGAENVKNSLAEPDRIKVVAASAVIENRGVKFTMPPLSAGVIRVSQ